MNTKHFKTKEMTKSAILIALVFVAVKLVNIPTAIGGVINLSDSLILLISVYESKHSSVLIAGTGSFLAEFFSPYAIFAPATLIVKSLMAYVSSVISKSQLIKNKNLRRLCAFSIAESIMIVGYFIYQAFFLNLGVITASLDIVNNLIQAVASIIIAFILSNIFERIM